MRAAEPGSGLPRTWKLRAKEGMKTHCSTIQAKMWEPASAVAQVHFCYRKMLAYSVADVQRSVSRAHAGARAPLAQGLNRCVSRIYVCGAAFMIAL